MKRVFILVNLFFLSLLTNAQAGGQGKSVEASKVFTKVEIEPGANPKAWAEHIRRRMQLPDSIIKDIPAGTYTVKVQFIIDKEGNISQVKAKNDPGYGFAKRAEKIILTYNGTWQPATQCGRNVNAYKEQPITFVIQPNNQPNL
jgi:protein TonB